MKVFNAKEEEIGVVSSGTFTSASGSLGMALVKKGNTKAGKTLFVEIRGKMVEAVIQKPPFVEPGYYRGA